MSNAAFYQNDVKIVQSKAQYTPRGLFHSSFDFQQSKKYNKKLKIELFLTVVRGTFVVFRSCILNLKRCIEENKF